MRTFTKRPAPRLAFAFFLLLGFMCQFASCKKKKPTASNETPAAFNKQELLLNYADNLILPQYSVFKSSLDSLAAAFITFKTKSDATNLAALQQQFHRTYYQYQFISPLEFGPAESASVRFNFNVFPCDTQDIKNNIAAGSYNLSAASNIDAKGFPALDFLLNGNGTNATTLLQSFTPAKKQYTDDLLKELLQKTNAVINEWQSAYREKFIQSLGTDVGSPIGFLINQLNFELDYLKNAKIGTPLGKKTLGVALPEKCESYFSGQQSVRYALASLTAIENMYLGRSYKGNNGSGFDDYLDHLNITHGSTSLNAAIQQQFSQARLKMNNLDNGTALASQVKNNSAAVEAAYNELLKLLVLLKTDLPSNLGVIITYQDGDGD